MSYAVNRALSALIGVGGDAATLTVLRARLAAAGPVELVTATDGNHGRALARMARWLMPARIYIPAAVAEPAVSAVLDECAEVVRTGGEYDDEVEDAATAAAAQRTGSVQVQDTAWPGYERIPGWIVDGYSTLFTEIDTQLEHAGVPPAGLTVVPVGVGALAQAALTHYRSQNAPTSVLAVEPDAAPAVIESLSQGRGRRAATAPTLLEGLNCGTPSSLAWPHLQGGLDVATTVTDGQAAAAVDELAAAGLDAGPCGAACLPAARRAAVGPFPCADLGLTSRRTVVSAQHQIRFPSGSSPQCPDHG